MTQEDYKKTLEAAQVELKDLLIRQEKIEQRIAQIKQAIISLAPLAEEPNSSFWSGVIAAMRASGISDACLQILQSTNKPLTPVEIKDQLQNTGVNLSGQKNVMASIHSALKRLRANEEIETKDNGTTYQWKTRRNPFASPGSVVGNEVGPLTMPPAKVTKKLTHPFRPGTYIDNKKE
jgi:hypothetical protein